MLWTGVLVPSDVSAGGGGESAWHEQRRATARQSEPAARLVRPQPLQANLSQQEDRARDDRTHAAATSQQRRAHVSVRNLLEQALGREAVYLTLGHSEGTDCL